MTRRDLLLVAYHFPPFGGSGVQRALKLARYLPQFGWRVHVLTAAHTHYPLMDAGLLDELPPDVCIHRVRGCEPGALAAAVCRPFGAARPLAAAATPLEDRIYWRLERGARRLGLAEVESLWVRAAIRAAGRLIRRHAIRAVLTTSPPHSIQRVGRALRRRFGLPWIADLRDPVLDSFVYEPATPRADRAWRRLEKTTVFDASRVVVTCPELAARLQARYPRVPAARFATITNGYDPADRPISCAPASGSATHHWGTGFQPVPTLATGNWKLETRNSKLKRFRLGSVGVFYRAQTIRPLLAAVRAVRAARPDLAPRIELRIVGNFSARQRKHLCDSDAAFLRATGQQVHARAVAEIARMDALFLMTPDHPGGRCCIPAKTFEYLAFGGHIVALVHAGTALERILREAGNASIVYHGDTAGLQAAIETCVDRWTARRPDEPRDLRAVERFRRDRIAARYAELIQSCLSEAEAAAPAQNAPRGVRCADPSPCADPSHPTRIAHA